MHHRNGHAARRKQPLRPTAYLDGLRGLGAVLLLILHNTEWSHADDFLKLQRTYGWRGEYYLAALPGVRLVFLGGYIAVPIFFVVSGYVLSARPLQHLHAHDVPAATRAIASALFRRWFRLFLPILATTFLWMTAWHVLRIENARPGAPPRAPTYVEELARFVPTFLNLGFRGVYFDHVYNVYTWAIPEEYRGSVVTLGAILACARFTTRARLGWMTFLTVYLLILQSKCALFTVGSLLCDLDLLRANGEIRSLEIPRWMWYIPMLIGLYFAGIPPQECTLDEFRRMPFCYPMWLLFPSAYQDFRTWYRFWGSLLITVSVPRLPWCKRFLETPTLQYLGGISYALYLVHGPVLWSIGARLYAACGRGTRTSGGDIDKWVDRLKLPSYGPTGLEVNSIVPQIVLYAVSIGLADLTARHIVLPCSTISQQWLEWSTDNEPLLPKEGAVESSKNRLANSATGYK